MKVTILSIIVTQFSMEILGVDLSSKLTYSNSMKSLIPLFFFISIITVSPPKVWSTTLKLPASTISDAKKVLDRASTAILSERKEGNFWVYPSHLGLMYISQYYLMTHWLEIQKMSSLDVQKLKTLIQVSQLKDGSWETLHDESVNSGNINATIFNYWALKVMGVSIQSSRMIEARNFILKNGGLIKSSLFTRAFLALFNNIHWDQFPTIPYFLFDNWGLIPNENDFGQWVGPHINALAYLKAKSVYRDLGKIYRLDELILSADENFSLMHFSKTPERDDTEVLNKLIDKQQKHGSVGGYTSSSILTLAVIKHYLSFSNIESEQSISLKKSFKKGFDFVETLYFKNFEGSYKGATCDGRYWDTALVGQGLIESGIDNKVLAPSAEYLARIQNSKSGGFGFGLDFENFEDTDDTAEILLFFRKMSIKNQWTQKAIDWLLEMQNSDGGWGAFSKNNVGNFVLDSFTNSFTDSADLFDESSPDVTGHVLEALSSYGYSIQNSKAIINGVQYLEGSQNKKFGGWEGRWGVNYIYGTSAAVIGLLKSGILKTNPMIKRALDWLESCANGDGGFGESFLSYTSDKYRCGATSSASQTSWALMALMEGERRDSPSVKNGIQFLTSQYNTLGFWKDPSFVGTGHPRIVPMEYPSYPKSFPLMALSRYLKTQ